MNSHEGLDGPVNVVMATPCLSTLFRSRRELLCTLQNVVLTPLSGRLRTAAMNLSTFSERTGFLSGAVLDNEGESPDSAGIYAAARM